MGIDAVNTAIFLDRDGVLNHITVDKDDVPHPPQSVEKFVLLPDVLEACHELKNAGYLLLVVTNQPDVARGTQTKEKVEAINAKLQELLPLDGLYVCYGDGADCACRKPNPGMLLQAQKDWQLDLEASVMVGDRYSDVLAGQAAGCKTLLINRGTYGKMEKCQPDAIAFSLKSAAKLILENRI